MNYYLDYRTSETLDPAPSCEGPVNYYLDYGTSETADLRGSRENRVNYCLIYGISETTRCPRRWPRWVNYYLDYRTSETAKSKWIENHYGELLLDLRCLRNLNVS